MKKIVFIFCCIMSIFVYSQTTKQSNYIDYNKNGRMDIFEDKTKPIEDRVEDLLKQMNKEEKQGQLLMDLGWQYYEREGNNIYLTSYAINTIQEKKVGSLWGFFRSDPWSGKTLTSAVNPQLSTQIVNKLQQYIIDSTRLGIPIFIAEECMHGIMQVGSTVYPTGIGQSSTWNRDIIKDMSKDIALLALSEGINICFGPLIDISRDARWSRVEETYGEDTYLTTQMGKSFVEGLVSNRDNRTVLPTLKHFAAYGLSEGGHNGASVHIGKRELHNDILPPFKECILSGAKLVMTSYNEIDGIPCTMNPYLLKNVLRERWAFDGIVISDLHSISGLRSHGVAKDLKQAAEKSILAGVDLDLSATDFYNNLQDIDEKRIDEAVKRVLYQKFACELFDNPFIGNYNYQIDTITPITIAKESIVLLENKDCLPLDPNKKQNICLIGPNANNVYNLLGDYTAPQDINKFITIKKALENFALQNKNIKVSYAKGCSIKDTSKMGFNEAIEKAKNSDIIIFCAGGSSSRYENIKYENTGAAKVENNTISDITSGEGFDRSSLELAGVQIDLLKELARLNKPIVLVLINGRPLILKQEQIYCDAILECFYPGQMGANAIVETLFGYNNPSGRLPISFPSNMGTLPCYYNTKRVGNRAPYLENKTMALYPFGFGRSYTTFEYSNFDIKVLNNKTDSVKVKIECNVRNIGSMDGKEVVQVYVKKLFSDYCTNEINLRGFDKKLIKKGESQNYNIIIDNDSFREWNEDATNFYLSKGEYEISIRKDALWPIFSTIINIE